MSTRVFEFERKEDPGGCWMPMALRMKLDLAGMKVGLEAWLALPEAVRAELVDAPASSDEDIACFADRVSEALRAAGQAAAVALSAEKRAGLAVWKEQGPAPAEVALRLEGLGAAAAWAGLERFGRYVLYHLASKGDDERFAVALSELLGDPRRPA